MQEAISDPSEVREGNMLGMSPVGRPEEGGIEGKMTKTQAPPAGRLARDQPSVQGGNKKLSCVALVPRFPP